MVRLVAGGMTVDAVRERKLCEKRRILYEESIEESPSPSVAKNSRNGNDNPLFSSFEEMLFRATPRGQLSSFTAELTISKMNHDGRQLKITHRLFLPLQAALVLGLPDDRPCPWCARIILPSQVTLPQRGTVQLVVRDGRGLAGKIFLLRIDLSDMPHNSQTIIRQKHYYENNLAPSLTLQHGLQISVKRIAELGMSKAALDNNGVLSLQPPRSVNRTILSGIRVVFSFNQAATIGCSTQKDTSMMKESLRITTEFALPGKYIFMEGSNCRLSQHGAIL